jgi:hypothetical protein
MAARCRILLLALLAASLARPAPAQTAAAAAADAAALAAAGADAPVAPAGVALGLPGVCSAVLPDAEGVDQSPTQPAQYGKCTAAVGASVMTTSPWCVHTEGQGRFC